MLLIKKAFVSFCFQTNTPIAKRESASAAASQSVDLLSDPLMEPFSGPAENKSSSEFFEDLTNDIDGAAENPSDETSEDFVDLLGSEAATQREEVDVRVEAAVADEGEATDLLGDGKTRSATEQETTSSAPIMDVSSDLSAKGSQQTPVNTKITDPLMDLLGDSPTVTVSHGQKPSGATIDLFDDEGSDIFTGAQPIKPTQQPQKSLFGEADEDLFGEPLGAVSKKSAGKEQKEKSLAAAPAGKPADIFTEEALGPVPNARSTRTVNSKTNGVHSEEDSDLFAGGVDRLLSW